MTRAQRFTLLGVLALALFLRLAWVTTARVDHLELFQFDMTWYFVSGAGIADGRGYVRLEGEPTAYWPPGYPLFLAAIFLPTDRSIAAVQVAQAVLGALTCLLCFLIGRTLFGVRVGILAAALLATCPDHIMFSGLLMSELLFTLFLTGFVWLFAEWTREGPFPPPLRCLALGVVVGAATLVRGTTLLMPLVLLAAWLIASRSLRASCSAAALVSVGMALAIGPWALRNSVRLGAPILVASQVGEVMMIAHSPLATGGITIRDSGTRRAGAQEHQERVEAYRFRFEHLPWPEREVEEMRAEVGRALRYMVSHPWEEIALVPERIRFLFEHGHAAMQWGRRPLEPLVSERVDRALTGAADLHFFTVLFLGLLGASRAWSRSRPGATLLPLLVVYLAVLHGVLFFGAARFHVPLLPCLSILAAAALLGAGLRTQEAVPTRGTRRSAGDRR